LRADLTVACDGRTSLVRAAAGLTPHEYPVPFDVGWFRLNRIREARYQLTPRFKPGTALILIPREGYFQAGLFLLKGQEQQLYDRGLETFRSQVAELVPEASVDSLTSWDDVKILDVRLNRLRRWHRKGLLCIGDAAHAMSPAGGVGINLAVADAVATARLLAGPLRAGGVTERDLAAVQRRRYLPAAVIQAVQRVLHRFLVQALAGTQLKPPPTIVVKAAAAVLGRFPALAVLPAYLVGVGPLPEHAPDFARRRPEPRMG
jgi:2-polyprenyl-6-methoxyphenol hydroxylase-like FAD-dependent oxidoreductase